MTADAWATALMVMPLEKGKVLVESHPQLEALWTVIDEERKIKSVKSDNW